MAVRVTATEVKLLIDGCDLIDDTVDIYILGANQFLATVFATGSTPSEYVLKEIERWLSAHMITVTRHRVTVEEKIGEASVVYAGKFGEGLSSTPYGQMVLQLDTTGRIASTGKKSASITAITSFDE